MKEKFQEFWALYRKSLLGLLLMLVLVPLGAFILSAIVVHRVWMPLPSGTEKVELTAAAGLTAETVTRTEPVTQPPSAAPPETEPQTTEPPESAMIEQVPFYSQRAVVPTGCELVSAKMVLEYYTHRELDIHKITNLVHAQYPKAEEGKICAPHPSQAFIGDPWDPTSFGCFAPVVCEMLNELLPVGYTAVDTSGTPLSELAETYIPQGRPVLVWATICMIGSYPSLGWYLTDEAGKPTDEWYEWPANEHCLVLIGYDQEYYYFNDPYAWSTGTRYSRTLVEQRWEEMGKYSVTVLPDPEKK